MSQTVTRRSITLNWTLRQARSGQSISAPSEGDRVSLPLQEYLPEDADSSNWLWADENYPDQGNFLEIPGLPPIILAYPSSSQNFADDIAGHITTMLNDPDVFGLIDALRGGGNPDQENETIVVHLDPTSTSLAIGGFYQDLDQEEVDGWTFGTHTIGSLTGIGGSRRATQSGGRSGRCDETVSKTRFFPRLLLLITVTSLAACSGQYLGIDHADLDPSTRILVDRAQSGDKNAQYDLSLRFALGSGIARDCGKARQLMRLAASDSGGTTWVYSPPVTKGGAGRVIPVDTGPKQAGLAKAKYALQSGIGCYAG